MSQTYPHSSHHLICIRCPRGCRLSAVKLDDSTWQIGGNQCPLGEKYGKQEMTDPRRVVTAVIKTSDKNTPYIPVRTDQPYPKDRIPALLNRLYKMEIALPVTLGQVLLPDIENTGINVIASESAE